MTLAFRTLPTDRLTRFLARWAAPITVILLALTAVARWFQAGLPAGADTAIHLFRAVELDWAIRHGYLYPRWSPDLVFGYGYPLFNVYGSGAQWVIVALHALGLNFIAATLGAFVVADALGALGAFSLARAVWGDTGGLIAAAAYTYAPYLLGSLYRGSAAEALALGLLPWLLWAFYRLHHAPTSWHVALAAIVYAVIPLLHNPSAVLATAIVVVFLTALAWANRHTFDHSLRFARHASRITLSALALGLLLSAFYWLPLIVEARYVQLDRGYGANVLNYRANFLSLRELLALPQPFDPKLIGFSAPRSLGLPQLLLALAGMMTLTRKQYSPEQKALLGLSAVGVLALSLMTLARSAWVWDHLPGLGLFQFPARLLGPASLLLALLAGAALGERGRPAARDERPLRATNDRCARRSNFLHLLSFVFRPAQRSLVPLAVTVIILFNLTWTFQNTDALVPAEPAIADLQAFERRTGALGTTTAGEYLPVWVREVPPPDALVERYVAGTLIHRLNPASLPEGARVISQSPGLISQKVELVSPVDFTAVFDVFYFPGWQAKVDGRAAPIRISAPHGLVTIPLAAGRHTVEIYFGTTPVRVIGGSIALAGLGIWIAVLVGGWTGFARNRLKATIQPGPLNPFHPLKNIGLIAIVLFVFKVAVADRRETVFSRTRFDGEQVAGIQTRLALSFGDQMQLLGYELSQASIPSGGTFETALYWRVLRLLDTDYSVSLALMDAAGHRFAQADSQHPAGFPTSRWPVDAYGRDAHTLTLLPGTPPGAYRLVANVYDYPDLTSLSTGVTVGEVTVTRPRRAAILAPAQRLNAQFGPLELVGAELGLSHVAVGTDLPLTLFWRSATAPAEDFFARVGLVNLEGVAVAERDLAPVRPDYPTSRWSPGETLRAPAALPVPADLRSGEYRVTLTLIGASGALAAPVVLGQVRVAAPSRVYTVPPVPRAAGARFGTIAELVGWGLNQNHLTLYWRALTTAEKSYTVFVHVLGPEGHIVSQRDTPPVNGARPTTSWLAGEVLVDDYDLELPSGEFTLAVGLYDQSTGERLRLENGDDHVVLRP